MFQYIYGNKSRFTHMLSLHRNTEFFIDKEKIDLVNSGVLFSERLYGVVGIMCIQVTYLEEFHSLKSMKVKQKGHKNFLQIIL